MKGEFVYANGYNISQARKLFKFYFGDFFIKADRNEKNLRFDVYVRKGIKTKEGILNLEDYSDLDYFNEYWNGPMKMNNPPFNVMVVSVDN